MFWQQTAKTSVVTGVFTFAYDQLIKCVLLAALGCCLHS